MSLHARLKRLEQRAHSDGLKHTPPVIFYETDEDSARLIAQAMVCPCCVVHVVLPEKGRGAGER
jgi:hypothetical protein